MARESQESQLGRPQPKADLWCDAIRIEKTSSHARRHPPLRFDKSRLPSRYVSVGPERAPHRAYYYAMGLTRDEITSPFVGVASPERGRAVQHRARSPGRRCVKLGVQGRGGTPREFTTITVTDGIAMGHPGMKSSSSPAR